MRKFLMEQNNEFLIQNTSCNLVQILYIYIDYIAIITERIPKLRKL